MRRHKMTRRVGEAYYGNADPKARGITKVERRA